MGLFRLPLLPVRGVIKLGELIQEEVEQELHDPARIRRELEAAERRHDAGEISDEEFAKIQDELAASLITEAAPPSVPGTVEVPGRDGKDRS